MKFMSSFQPSHLPAHKANGGNHPARNESDAKSILTRTVKRRNAISNQ